MIIRYTQEEWRKLSWIDQITRQDLAPDGGMNEHRQGLQAALESCPDTVADVATWLSARNKAQQLIEYYQSAGDVISKRDFVAHIESQSFTALDIAELVNIAVNKRLDEKREAGKARDTGWLPAIIELWLKYGEEFETKEEFCDDYAGRQLITPSGQVVKAPKTDTMRKKLTDKNIAMYRDRQDVERRRNGIS